MIITFTGPSGSGKTTIAKAVIERIAQARMMTSCTTRAKRPTDLADEYAYLDNAAFDRMRDAGEFLWTAQVADARYGSTKQSVSDALRYETAVRIMILVPDVLSQLYAFAARMDKREAITSFFIRVSDEDVLRARMLERGDTPESVEKRITACHDFEEKAKATDVPFICVDNSGELDAAVEKIMSQISSFAS